MSNFILSKSKITDFWGDSFIRITLSWKDEYGRPQSSFYNLDQGVNNISQVQYAIKYFQLTRPEVFYNVRTVVSSRNERWETGTRTRSSVSSSGKVVGKQPAGYAAWRR